MSTILVNNVKSYTGSTVTISGSNIAVQGNTTLGDNSGVDTITVNGHITASGNISASGTVFASNFKSAGASGEAMSFNDNVDLDGTFTMDGATFDVNATGAVTIDSVGLSIDNAGVAANITSTTDGAAEDFTISLAGATDSSLILSSTGTGADALQITTTAGGIDISATGNAAGEDIDISSAASVNVTATEDAANAIYLRANGGTSETVKIHADQGTGAASIELTSDAGSIDINSGDNITVDAADEIIVTTTSADGHIALVSAHTAGQAIHLDGNANAGSIVDIDAGILDIDVTAAATIDAVGIALGAGSGELDLTTTGLMDINSAALDIDTSGAITIDAAGVASHVAIVTAHTAGQAFHLDADANAGSIVDIDAGILDIDVTGAATIDAASLVITGAVTAATGVQSTATALTATDAGVAIPAGTAAALINADSDANHIVILPAPVVGNIINIIETATTGYELRSSTPASIAINGGTASNGESAIAGAITYIKCVCVSSTSWICSQYDADGDESKVEAAA